MLQFYSFFGAALWNFLGGVRTFLVSTDLTRTWREWMAHEMQYAIFRYIFGMTYPGMADASDMSLTAACGVRE